MTTYEILRTETSADRAGNPEFFADIQLIDHEMGTINYPYWFKGEQALLIISDAEQLAILVEAMIPSILEFAAAQLEEGE